jgi:signal transduction histidine kinase
VFLVFGLDLWGIEVLNLTPESRRYPLIVLHVFAQIICAGAFVLGYQRQLLAYQQRVALIVDQLNSEVMRREIAERASVKAGVEKDQFLRNVSHVFRKPLNNMVACTEQLLQKYTDQSELVSSISAINRDSRNLHYFVSELLMLDATLAMPLELTDARPAKVLHEIVVAVEAEAKRFDLTLALTIDPICFAIIAPVDVARLSLALHNLLLFAVRQSSAGIIHVNAERIDDILTISIIDCAPAYSESMLNNLFDMHYDLVLDNKKDLPSSAFSLKIAAVIVKRHGGSLSVSHVESGNQMVLALPLSTPSVTLS